MIKFFLAQPANIKFQWELDVALTNIRSLDKKTPIVLLFLQEREEVVEHFRGRYPKLEIQVYPDKRDKRNYLPTIRPYLIWQYLKEDPTRERHDYFQIDSDIIFRELPDFTQMPTIDKVAWASDCEGYIGYEYLRQCKNGPAIINRFAHILNIDPELIRYIPGGGAQWLIARPTAQLWWHIWQDSQIFHDFIQGVDSDIQKWTVEMWAQLYNMVKFGWEVKLHPELDFIRPTDPIEQWDKVKILHNAGVTGELTTRMFYKGNYLDKTPFAEDFSWVDKATASSVYVQAIEKVLT